MLLKKRTPRKLLKSFKFKAAGLMEDIDSIDSRLLSFFNGNFDILKNVLTIASP
jgi:hypothetical protein